MKPYFFLCVRIHEKTLPDFFQIFKLISSGCTSALKWTQLTLNGLNKKKLQFSRYSNETCFIQLYSSRQLIWAIVEPDWTEIERVMSRWKNVAFCFSACFGPKIDILLFPEKLMTFFLENLDSVDKNSGKNYGENFFYQSLTIFCQFTIDFFCFFLYFSINAITSLWNFNCELSKNG